MSLLSRHLASPAQASNFLWLSVGLPSMWGSGVDNKPHLRGSWVPEAPLLQAFEESIHVLPGGLPLWPAPLFSISCEESIEMLKGGSKLMSHSEMCWKMPVWRRLLQMRMSWTQILLKLHLKWHSFLSHHYGIGWCDRWRTIWFRVKQWGLNSNTITL